MKSNNDHSQNSDNDKVINNLQSSISEDNECKKIQDLKLHSEEEIITSGSMEESITSDSKKDEKTSKSSSDIEHKLSFETNNINKLKPEKISDNEEEEESSRSVSLSDNSNETSSD